VSSTGPSTARLKKANVLRISSQRGGQLLSSNSPEASIYSTYLVLFSRVVSSGLRAPTTKRAPPTLSEVITRLNLNHPSLPSSPMAAHPSLYQEEETTSPSTPPVQARLLDATSGHPLIFSRPHLPPLLSRVFPDPSSSELLSAVYSSATSREQSSELPHQPSLYCCLLPQLQR
jgi:hypothetical protein